MANERNYNFRRAIQLCAFGERLVADSQRLLVYAIKDLKIQQRAYEQTKKSHLRVVYPEDYCSPPPNLAPPKL